MKGEEMSDETYLTDMIDNRVKMRLDQTDSESMPSDHVRELFQESMIMSEIRLAYSKTRMLDAVRGMLVLTYALCLVGVVLVTVLQWMGVM